MAHHLKMATAAFYWHVNIFIWQWQCSSIC